MAVASAKKKAPEEGADFEDYIFFMDFFFIECFFFMPPLFDIELFDMLPFEPPAAPASDGVGAVGGAGAAEESSAALAMFVVSGTEAKDIAQTSAATDSFLSIKHLLA